MSVRFSQLVKSGLTSLIVVPAYASFIGGSLRKAKEKPGRDNEVGVPSIEKSLYWAYHGNEAKGIALHTDRFCQMSGVFENFVKKGMAEDIISQIVVGESSHAVTGATKNSPKSVKLHLDKLLRMDNCYYVIDGDSKKRLRLTKLNDSGITSNNPINAWSLLGNFNTTLRGVKKILSIERRFLGPDNDLPSGKSIDDLFHFIWEDSWKQYSYMQHHNAKLKESLAAAKQKGGRHSGTNKTGCNDDDDSSKSSDSSSLDRTTNSEKNKAAQSAMFSSTSDGFIDDMDDDDLSIKIPATFKTPELKYNGKWNPKGWWVYVAYVCRYSRVCDDFIEFFTGDGKSLDKSKAPSRRKDRESTKIQNNQIRDAERMVGVARGTTHEEVMAKVQIAQNMSNTEYNRALDKYQAAQLEKQSLLEEKKQLWLEMTVLYDNDPELMRSSEEWETFSKLNKDLRASSDAIAKAKKIYDNFDDKYGNAAEGLMSNIGIGKTVDQNPKPNKKKRTLSPCSSPPPPPVQNVNHNILNSPVSQLEDSSVVSSVAIVGDKPLLQNIGKGGIQILGSLQKTEIGNTAFPSVPCQYCKSGIPTRHYCMKEIKKGKAWKYNGKLICGVAFCCQCTEENGYVNNVSKSRTRCPAHK